MAIGSRRFQVYIALFSRVGIHRFLDLSVNLHDMLGTRVEDNGILSIQGYCSTPPEHAIVSVLE